MKKTLLLLLLFLEVVIFAQNPIQITNPYNFNKYVTIQGYLIVNDSMHVDSILLMKGSNKVWLSPYTMSKYTQLSYTAENVANKNMSNGYAGLNSSGQVPSSELPSLVISNTYVDASESAMLTGTRNVGDLSVRTDSTMTLILKQTPSSSRANWVTILTPSNAPVQSVNSRTGNIILLPSDVGIPSLVSGEVLSNNGTALNWRNLAISDITGLTTALAGKEPSITSGSGNQYWNGSKAWSAIDLTQSVTNVLPVANGGTGSNTANGALNNLLPSQSGQNGKVITSNGTSAYWGASSSLVPSDNILHWDGTYSYYRPYSSYNSNSFYTSGLNLMYGGTMGENGYNFLTTQDSIKLNLEIQAKQNTLVSGSNIKTINGSSVLGFGNLSITSLSIGLYTGTQSATPFNVWTGYGSLNNLSTGIGNTSAGTYSLNDVNSGNYNSGLGYYSGSSFTFGNNNLYLGSYAGHWDYLNQSNKIFINTLDRGSLSNDTTKSPIYIKESTTLSGQVVYLNGNVKINNDSAMSASLWRAGTYGVRGGGGGGITTATLPLHISGSNIYIDTSKTNTGVATYNDILKLNNVAITKTDTIGGSTTIGTNATSQVITQRYFNTHSGSSYTFNAPLINTSGTVNADTGWHKSALSSYYQHQKDSIAIAGKQVAGSYAPATSGTSILKGNGSGGFNSASAGTDYQSPISATLPIKFSSNTISADTGYHKNALASYYQHQKDSILIAGKQSAGTYSSPNDTTGGSGTKKIGTTYQVGLKAPIASPTFTTQIITPVIYGGSASGGNLTLKSTSNATQGNIYFGNNSVYQDATSYLGIGTTIPSYNLSFGQTSTIGAQSVSGGNGLGLSIMAGTTGGGGSPFTAQGAGTRSWYGISVNSSNGDVWATVNGGDIYKSVGGTGAFTAQSAGTRNWRGISVNPSNGDVWAVEYNGDIYKSAGGTGAFTAQSAGIRSWEGISVNSSNGDVWATVLGVDIYKSVGGTGAFTAQSAGSRNWVGISVNPSNGDVWAVVLSGDIYKNAGGTGAFTAQSAGTRNWYGISVNPSNGDVWAVEYNGDIYKSVGGTGAFTAQSAGIRSWYEISVNPSNGDVWATVTGGDIYKQTLGLNQSGGNINLSTGLGTGNSNPSISFVTSTPTTSGTTNQSSSEKMRITGQGYLGINTTTPQFYIDVNGSSRIAGANGLYFGGTTTSASDYSHSFYNSSGSLIIQPRVDANPAFQFQNAAGTQNVLDINTTNQNVFIGKWQSLVIGSIVSSASTITPTSLIFHVSGTTTISTINIPFTGWTGQITIIPDGLFLTTTGGNIAIASSAIVNKALIMTFDGTNWYPSY